MLWVMSGKFFSQTPKFSERIWLDWEPPLSPLPYHDGRNISKIKLRWTPITHPRMLKSDTHLGLILSSNFLIGSLAESLLSESNVRTIRTSSDFSANKKQGKKHLLQLELELFIQGWFGKPTAINSPNRCENLGLVSSFSNGLQTVQLYLVDKTQQRTQHVSCDNLSGVKWEHLLIIH